MHLGSGEEINKLSEYSIKGLIESGFGGLGTGVAKKAESLYGKGNTWWAAKRLDHDKKTAKACLKMCRGNR